MNPVFTVTGYICPRCNDLHEDYRDAVECCQESPPVGTRYECAECETYHADFAEAEACCSEQDKEELLGPEYLRHVPHRQLELHGQLRLL